MQGNLDPISPYGRAFLGGVQGASPDQVAQRAAEVDKAGLIPFADAIRIKQMADQLSKSGAGMNQPQQGTVLDSLRGQIQSALGPQQMAPQQMPPQDQYAGLRALPVPDDMYADVGMAGGGIVAFQGGGRIPYEESILGRLTTPVGEYFSRLYEEDMRGAAQRRAAAGAKSKRDWAEVFGGELPPQGPLGGAPYANPPPQSVESPLAGSANMLAAAGYKAPTMSDLTSSSRPFTMAPDLRPGDKAPPRLEGLPSLLAPSAAQRPAAPPRLTESSLEKFKKEAEEEYKPLAERFREYDSVLKKRGADIEERAAASSKWLAAMTGFQMAAEASKPGATFLGSAGAAGAEYAKNRIEMNERFADKYDALTDAQFKMATAQAQLEFDKSERAYDRFYKAQDDVYKQQTLLNQVLGLDIERSRVDVAREELAQERLAGDPATAARLMGIEQRELASIRSTQVYQDAERRLIMAQTKLQNPDIDGQEYESALAEYNNASRVIKDMEASARARIYGTKTPSSGGSRITAGDLEALLGG